MSFRLLNSFLLFLIIFLIFGCSNHEGDKLESLPEYDELKVSLIDEVGYEKLVRQRDGKILLVNVWATWCIPCREEFPDLVKIANKYQNKNIEVIGISTDYPDEIESKIKPFLKSQNANFKNYVKNVEDDEALINSINPEWSGTLPATFIYDTMGVLCESHFGQNDFAGFQKMIEQVQKSKTK